MKFKPWFSLVFACGLLCSCAALEAEPGAGGSDAEAVGPASSDPLGPVIADVCGKQVVFLGEDASHGSGRAIDLKVALVKRLVEKCNFTVLLFESEIYDFLNLERAVDAHTATSEQLADAVGGLWSTTREIDPLIPYLFNKMARGQIVVRGLDPQIGGATQLFAHRHLANELTQQLAEARRSQCTREIDRLAQLGVDTKTPFGRETQQRLMGCLEEIHAAMSAEHQGATSAVPEAMVLNLLRYASDGQNPGFRDRAMYDNFIWHRSRLRPGAKVIIWCATIHAIKEPLLNSGRVPLGAYVHRLLGDQAAVIAFSAKTGSYGRQGQPPRFMPTAPSDSLEGLTVVEPTGTFRYLDRKQLEHAGVVMARPISYGAMRAADWARLFDGLVIFDADRPPAYVRQAVPQRTEH